MNTISCMLHVTVLSLHCTLQTRRQLWSMIMTSTVNVTGISDENITDTKRTRSVYCELALVLSQLT